MEKTRREEAEMRRRKAYIVLDNGTPRIFGSLTGISRFYNISPLFVKLALEDGIEFRPGVTVDYEIPVEEEGRRRVSG